MSERADMRIRLGRAEPARADPARLWPLLSSPDATANRGGSISARHFQVSAEHHPCVLLAHDQALLRAALASLLGSAFPSWVLHTSDSVASASARILQVDADLVVLGLPAQDGDAASTIRELRQNHPATRIVVLLAAADRGSLLNCLEAGAQGVVQTSQAPAQVIGALAAVMGCRFAVPPQPGPAQRLLVLTSRQREVLGLLTDGLSTKEIARRLGLGIGTVKVHLSNLYRALEARNRTEAVVKARPLALHAVPNLHLHGA